jgi:hydrogenase-4 component B
MYLQIDKFYLEIVTLLTMITALALSLWSARASHVVAAISSSLFILYGLYSGEFRVFYVVSGLVWLFSSTFSALHDRERWYSLTFSGTLLGIMITLLSQNYLEFLTGWELMTLFAYASIGVYRREWRPGYTFLAFGEVSTVLLIAGFILAYQETGTFLFHTLTDTLPLWFTTFGFTVKMGIFPFLVVEWLPIAHGNAKPSLSSVLSASMTLAGVYGIYKMMSLCPQTQALGGVLILIGAFSVLFGALYSYVSDHMKGTLAFSTIENNGAILTALGSLELSADPVLKAFAQFSLMVYVVAHSLAKTGLFLVTGYVHGESMSTLSTERSFSLEIGTTLLTASMSGLLPTVGGVAVWSLLETLFMESISVRGILGLIPLLAGVMVGMGEGFATGAMARFTFFTSLVRPRGGERGRLVLLIGLLMPVLALLSYLLSPEMAGAASLGMFSNSLIPSGYSGGSFGGISPLYVLILLPILSLITYLASGRRRVRTVDPWDNGSGRRLTYTSFGMANNIRLMLRSVLRTRKGAVETSADVFWRAILQLVRGYVRFSRAFSRAYMNSSISWYMIYMILAFIVVILVVFL